MVISSDATYGGTVIITGSLTVTNAATLTLDGGVTTMHLTVEENLLVTAGARIVVSGAAIITAANATVASGGTVEANGLGYGASSGPGAGSDGVQHYEQAGGGGHGGWGEFVLAELTLPFDQSDVAYFFPLMADTTRRLGFRPRYGALDAAYDSFYVYEYFHRAGQPLEAGFAAVPLSKRGGKRRQFDAQGLSLCEAGLAMPLKLTCVCRTTRVERERGRYACPLVFPEPSGESCPIQHKNWPKGCITTLATSVGARIRHQLDRDSALYKEIYNQRTAAERIFSQALVLGIERPKLRNGQAIANQNSLIYVLLNLRALHRVRQQKARNGSTA